MLSSGLTFKCGACGNFMAVGNELRGRPVRCPHCQQVVTAPMLGPVGTGPGAGEAPVSVGSLSQELMSPHGPAGDGANLAEALPESIGEPLTLDPKPATAPEESHPFKEFNLGMEGIPSEESLAASQPQREDGAAQAADPWVGLNGDNASEAGAPVAEVEQTFPAATVSDSAGDNPWSLQAGTPGLASPGEQRPWSNEQPQEVSQPRPESFRPGALPASAGARPRARIPVSFWLIALLLPFALILIPVASYVLISKVMDRGQEKQVHPLESIQDDGLYKELEEGKRPIIDPRLELPKDQPALRLGQTGRFGGLEVTPLEVVRQKLPFSFYRGAANYTGSEEALVLRLRLKNVSDSIFHPHDPVFNRAYGRSVRPYTFLTIGDKEFYGPVVDPATERIRGQNFGELLPGESLETIVVASQDPNNARLADELKKAPPSASVIWRVQLRKGRETVRGRSVWVTTVVPVEFKISEIKDSAKSSTRGAEK